MSLMKHYDRGTKEYENLEKMSELLTQNSPNGYLYYVGDTFFDRGQNWVYTTILSSNGNTTFQCLNPKQYGEVIKSTCSIDLKMVLNDYLGDRFCPDRKRETDRPQKIYQFSLG